MALKIPQNPNNQSMLIPLREWFDPNIVKGPSHWTWTGSTHVFDNYFILPVYIETRNKHKNKRFIYVVSRSLWMINNQGIAAHGLQLRSRCDLDSCINPAHVRTKDEIVNYTLTLKHTRFSLVQSKQSLSIEYDDRSVDYNNTLNAIHVWDNKLNNTMCYGKYLGTPTTLPIGMPIGCPTCARRSRAIEITREVY